MLNQQQQTPCLRAALIYADHANSYGWKTFPAKIVRGQKSSYLKAARSPEGLNWGMTSDPDLLIKNFSSYRQCGVGIPTGEINGIFVVEIDTPKGHNVDGVSSLRRLEKQHGRLPKTLMARSPSGSVHYYFNHPGIKVWNSASRIAPGIDVRGDGGMVIAPPSKRADGEYVWLNDEAIDDAPIWLLALVTVQIRADGTIDEPDNNSDDPFAIFAKEQQEWKAPLDIEELFDTIRYRDKDGSSVHETELLATSSMLSSGYQFEEIISYVIDQVFDRVPEARGWNRNTEIIELRKLCIGWILKNPELLDMQESIPDWVKKKLNGHTPKPKIKIVEEEPTPEALAAAEPHWPRMDADALHGLAGEVVRMIEPHTEADPNAILLQFLAYFGNAVGRDHYYPIERSRHHGNLFVVLTGDTAKARKGTSADWLRDLMSGVGSEWWKCIKGGLSSGEGVIWDIRDDAEVIDPVTGNVIVGVPKDKRRLFDEREFSRVLSMMKREGNILSHVIRDAWDGRALSVITKNNPIRCTGAHISICGHITSDELKRDLDNTSMANGYANRFLFACVKRSKELPFGSEITQATLDAMAQKISQRVEKIWLVEKAVTMDKQARELWSRIYHDLSEAKPGLLGAVTARAEAQVVRLALIYALLDGVDEIRPSHLKAGLAVWKYCEESARYVFGSSLGDGVADTINESLRHAGSAGLTRTDLYNSFGRNVTASRIAIGLLLLQKFGLARVTHKVGRGRPVETWFCT